ncbi:MAG: hypothetical protein HZA83_03065, partial [Thaumarchaeota archaeon]|nr:hypothetical protein [Nitrososphaerota archaeon]
VCDSSRPYWKDVLDSLKVQMKWTDELVPWRSLDNTCKIDSDCAEKKFLDTWESNDKEVRMFMIGQGATFADFNDANPYCKDRMNLAVKWLAVDPENPQTYPLPKKERADCFLDFGVVPVYILYSQSKDINAEWAGKIAEELKDSGPVIITTEIDFDSSNPQTLKQIADQVVAIYEGCGGDKRQCMIALAPKMGDTKAVDDFFTNYAYLKDKVDMVAYGINTRYSHAECDNPAALYSEALNFSKHILYEHGKPSLVAYTLLEPGYNADKGTEKECIWSEAGIADTYAYFFPYALPSFIKRGVLGFALYNFNSTSDPLNCPSCKVADNPTYLQNWFGFCQKYKTDVANLPRGEMFSVFPSKPSGGCTFASNPQYFGNIPYGSIGAAGPQFMEAITPELDPKNQTAFRCEWCVNNVTDADNWPDDLQVGKQTVPDETFCTQYPELDKYADYYDLDPMLLRAIVWHESGFQKCAASIVGPGDACYEKAYDGIVDPAGECTKEAGKKYCAFGLTQVIESPYIYWPDSPTNFPELVEQFETLQTKGRSEAIAYAKGCSKTFNPFDPANAACMGAYKINKALNNYLPEMKKHADLFNLVDEDGNVDENKVRIMATYLALHEYFGDQSTPNGATNDFVKQKNLDKTACFGDKPPGYCENPNHELDKDWYTSCVGQKNFMTYVQVCVIGWAEKNNPKPHGDYGAEVLAQYRGLSEKCEKLERSGCPPVAYVKNHVLNPDNKIAEPESAQPAPQPEPQPNP